MYLHVDMLEGRKYECYLDGVYQKSAFAASEEEGWVARWALDPDGKPLCTPWCTKTDENGNESCRLRDLIPEKVYGKVELRLKTS